MIRNDLSEEIIKQIEIENADFGLGIEIFKFRTLLEKIWNFA